MWMTRVSINHPVFATMVMVALTVLGLFSYAKLGVEAMPDVRPPVVSIQVRYPGASPEQVENDLAKPIENAVNTVAGVKRILSASYEGISFSWIEFRLDVDTDRVTQEVRDKIAQIRAGFPRDVKDPGRAARRRRKRRAGCVLCAVGQRTVATPANDARRAGRAERLRACQWRRQGLARRHRDARNSGARRSRPVDRVRSDGRSGGHRAAQRERQRSGRHDQQQHGRSDRSRRRPHRRARQLRQDHRRAQERGADHAVAGCRSVRHRARTQLDRAHQRRTCDQLLRLQGAGRQHRAGRRQPEDRRRRHSQAVAGGYRAEAAALDFGLRQGCGQQRQDDDHRRRAADGADRVSVSWQLAQHGDYRAHAADRGDRDVHFAQGVRLHVELHDDDGAQSVHRPADRRRDRRAREHRAPYSHGQGSLHGGARRHRRNRTCCAGDDVLDRRGVRADRVHGRHRRQVLLSVRHHGRGRGAGVTVRQLHARSDAVCCLARSAARHARSALRRPGAARLRSPHGSRTRDLWKLARLGSVAAPVDARHDGAKAQCSNRSAGDRHLARAAHVGRQPL